MGNKQLQINTNVIPYPKRIQELFEIEDSRDLNSEEVAELESWYAKQDMDYLSKWNAAVLADASFFQIPSS